MPIKFNIAVPISHYTNKEDVEVTKWQYCGTVIEKLNGKFAMKLNCLPTACLNQHNETVAWDGWMQLLPYREPEQLHSQETHPVLIPGEQLPEDDIPF